jgi:NAD(P)-dependent dehydrogenase (short-subunit alcohol dehydrogenase family)
MSGRLEGKTALVTGGTAGIGLATAQRFVKEGAYVFVTGRRQAELDSAAKLVRGHVTAVKADSSNLDDLDNLFAQIKREKGRLDIVCANAGCGSFAPIGGITEQHFDHTFDTNVKGTLFTVQKALPLVPDGGSIIMTASTAG